MMADAPSFSSEVVEMALAHAIGSKVEAAYRRGDLFEKRRKLMEAWAGFCAAPSHTTLGTAASALAAQGSPPRAE